MANLSGMLKLPGGGSNVNFRIKLIPSAPFDRSIIKRNWKAINRSPLQRAGVYVRRKMRDLIRKDTSKKQKPSKPGKPPKARPYKGGYPFRLIYSVPDQYHSRVIIGHVGWGANQTPMELHEFGKTKRVSVIIRQPGKRLKSAAARAAARRKYLSGAIPQKFIPRTTRLVRYPKREFAHPALMKTISKLPALWLNSVSNATVKN